MNAGLAPLIELVRLIPLSACGIKNDLSSTHVFNSIFPVFGRNIVINNVRIQILSDRK